MSDLSGLSDLAYAAAIEIAHKIQKKELSSRETLDYFLARVESLDKTINSVVTIDAERARAEADAADAALARGENLGPLHGVPMTIKDSFQTKGMRTTSGAPELTDFVPPEDAWPVARLREAGAIIYGKTNLPIYAGDLQSYNDIFGTTNNPHDPSRTPGGSSGGSDNGQPGGATSSAQSSQSLSKGANTSKAAVGRPAQAGEAASRLSANCARQGTR